MRIGCILLICCSLLFSSYYVKGQATSVGLGVRLTPDGGGFSAKFFPEKYLAIEAQLNGGASYFNGPGIAFVGLAEYHIILPDPSWRLFFGPGLHFGSWDRYDDGYPQAIFGLDGIFGVEYMFRTFPLGISADVKPAINFVRDYAWYQYNLFGLSARYYFGKGVHQSRYNRHKG